MLAGGLEGMNLMAAYCKLSLLDLGRMDVDDGFFIRGATAALLRKTMDHRHAPGRSASSNADRLMTVLMAVLRSACLFSLRFEGAFRCRRVVRA